MKARAIAIYLPQFHPIPENDEWWGAGFSEWTNVARARPLYRGHYQPNIPGELGFYDLRAPGTRAAQAAIATEHGIEAFCYWHYWFAGRRLLERPFQEVLASGEPDFGFCLAWANQDWASIWTGKPGDLLVKQTYPGPKDHERHFYELLPAFTDKRYVTVDGKPVFMVYRPVDLPEAAAFADQWRALAEKEGLPGLYLLGERKGGSHAVQHGFDADLHPRLYDVAPRSRFSGPVGVRIERLLRRRPRLAPYTSLAELPWAPATLPRPELPLVLSNWDNTPRFGRHGFVLTDSTPAVFGRAMQMAVDAVQTLPDEQRLVFIKSWNEWAEGNYIEPDRRYGRGYLEAVATAVQEARHSDHLLRRT